MKKWLNFLQIIAFIMVFLFIISPSLFPGGFIGIDLALVLAGYYFSTLVLDSWIDKKQNHWQLFAKYVLQTIGLFVLLIIVVVPLAWFFNQNFLAGITKQLVAVFGFSTNFYEIAFGGSFANRVEPHLFLQLWPICIVLQSALVSSVMLTILNLKNSALAANNPVKKIRKNIFLVSGILTLASLICLLIGMFINIDMPTLLYSSLSHSFPFFTGSVIGSFIGNKWTTNKFQEIVLKSKAVNMLVGFFAGVLLLLPLIFILNVDQKSTYVWGILLATLISCCLLVQGRILSEKTLNELSLIDLVASLTLIIYLFFWPAYFIFSSKMNAWLGAFFALAIAGCIAFGLRFIIQPLFKNTVLKLPFNYPKKNVLPSILGIGGLLTILTIVAVLGAPVLSASSAAIANENLNVSVVNINNTSNNLGGYIEGELIKDWENILTDSESAVDIAIYSPKYNRIFAYTNSTSSKKYYTASIVKASILTELLHQKELSGTSLTDTENDYATHMIIESDNDAATTLLNNSLRWLRCYYTSL